MYNVCLTFLLIKQRQQGFLKGRSIIKDLLDIDNNMLLRSLEKEGGGAAIFLDFAAAFPSMSQDFI